MTRSLLAGLFALTSTLGAQAPSPVDSVDHLNAGGRWQDALVLARARITGSSKDESCTLSERALWSLRQMGRYDGAASSLKSFDGDCATSTVARERAAELARIRRDVTLPDMPPTGFDTSAMHEFWKMVDTLSADHEPADAMWHTFFATPGYRLSFTNVQPLREDLEISYRPSRRAERDSLMTKTDDQGARLRHFARAVAERVHLQRIVDSLVRSLPIPAAVALAQRFLPPGATVGHSPPLVTLAIFRDDAYSAGARGIVVDVIHAEDSNLTELLAHEFHHSYIGYVSKGGRAPAGSPDAGLVNALFSLRNEGSADQIDKPYPLTRASAVMAQYVARYNDEYVKTPATLHTIDSLVTAAAGDTAKLRAVGERASVLFWSGGHPSGAYMTRTLFELFGKDSLYAVERDPFSLLRVYASAVVAKGGANPLSPAIVALVEDYERKYRQP